MKLINEKGKLFGIINVVDLLVLLAVVCVLGAIVWQLLGDQVNDAISEQAEMTMVVAIAGAHPDLVDEVMRQDIEGSKIVTGNQYLDAYVSRVWLEDYVKQIETADGDIVDGTDPTKQDIMVEIKTTVAKDTPSPKIGSQEVRAGRTFIVKTQTFECSGTIYYVDIAD
ncbi:MAG: DUF4330 domain-containing protein [Bacillota bacterium]|nr:DUF4330 domain-containing protein [Bacillota bacterium]